MNCKIQGVRGMSMIFIFKYYLENNFYNVATQMLGCETAMKSLFIDHDNIMKLEISIQIGILSHGYFAIIFQLNQWKLHECCE